MKNSRYNIAYCLLPIAYCLLFSSCSQQKNRWINRAYHNTTTRYNIYFNGNESFKDGMFAIENSNKEDYSKILPVFVYGDDASSKSATSQMDKAILKGSKGIQRHSMFIKEVEYCSWIDDCYMLIGKAQFYKREYRKALETFEYVAKAFKHDEIKHDAQLWVVRTQMQLNDFEKANKLLDLIAADVKRTQHAEHSAQPQKKGKIKIEPETEHKTKPGKNKKSSSKNKKKSASKKKTPASHKATDEEEQGEKTPAEHIKPDHENHDFPDKLLADYYSVYSDFYIRQENYKLSIPELRDAIAHTKKKKRRMRLLYIFAQIYQQENKYDMATKYYSQVLKMNPPYEMAFYATINRAMSYDVEAGNSEEIKKQLMKMAKDDKNKEFFDQIYYALADIELKEGHEELGIEYLKKSAKLSMSNNNQKGRAYLRLADIYFDKKDYQPAQAYYDSTVSLINKDRKDYPAILNKRNNLTKLVKNMLIIEREDSLQALAGLNEKQRNKVIDGIIQDVIDEEEQKKLDAQQAAFKPPPQQGNPQNTNTTGSEWYFYNTTTLSYGFSEFKRLWGDRILEDNWRRKTKSLASAGAPQEELEQLEEKDTGKVDIKSREYYMKNIPMDKDKMNKSHNKLIEAYYDLGLVYKEQFENNEQAIATFETLLRLYDTCRYVLPSYYQLYRLYLEQNNNEKAEYYKNKILKEFPNSDYAKVILNPDYFKELQKEKLKEEDFYQETFQTYKEQLYAKTIENCNDADTKFPKTYLAPKFHFLKALAIGKSQDLGSFENSLKDVIQKHPKDQVAAEAQKIIDLIHKKEPVQQKIDSVASLYQFKSDTKHSCVLIFPASVDAKEIKTAISDFDTKFFAQANLNVSTVPLDNDRQMISIKFFDDMNKAMNYYKQFKTDNDLLKNINSKGYTLFVISYENFAVFYDKKKAEDYLSFFTKNYPVN